MDGHLLKVVATDGMELRDPVTVDSVIVTPGERYDFELQTKDTADNYWIKAKTLEVRSCCAAVTCLIPLIACCVRVPVSQ